MGRPRRPPRRPQVPPARCAGTPSAIACASSGPRPRYSPSRGCGPRWTTSRIARAWGSGRCTGGSPTRRPWSRRCSPNARTRMQPVVSKVVERAQAAGVLRADLYPTDIPLLEFMLSASAEYALQVRPEIWRRYLALMLDALRPDRAGTTELPEPALSPEEMVQAMRAGSLNRE